MASMIGCFILPTHPFLEWRQESSKGYIVRVTTVKALWSTININLGSLGEKSSTELLPSD